MSMVIGLGAALGVGLMLVITGCAPARPPLALALARLHAARPTRIESVSNGLLVGVVGSRLARTDLVRQIMARSASDLRITTRTIDELLAQQVTCLLCGLLWAPATAALMELGGVSVSWILPLWCSLALGLAGILLPLVSLKASACERRRGFRDALSCYLDLVAVRLAGGAGVDGALSTSARSGQGWAFTEIRHALDAARLMGEPPWSGLDRLGTELEIDERRELAASVTLAGDEGARVRESIAAKARAIRQRGLADAEAAAQSASERMSLPIVLLMLGFVVFLGYPAVMQVLTGL
jgi:Flp pilus assembly protein TadB